jgi:hypothetical protein
VLECLYFLVYEFKRALPAIKLISKDTKSIIVTCLVVTKELVSRDTKSTFVTCLVVTEELVSRDTK